MCIAGSRRGHMHDASCIQDGFDVEIRRCVGCPNVCVGCPNVCVRCPNVCVGCPNVCVEHLRVCILHRALLYVFRVSECVCLCL